MSLDPTEIAKAFGDCRSGDWDEAEIRRLASLLFFGVFCYWMEKTGMPGKIQKNGHAMVTDFKVRQVRLQEKGGVGRALIQKAFISADFLNSFRIAADHYFGNPAQTKEGKEIHFIPKKKSELHHHFEIVMNALRSEDIDWKNS